MARTQVDPLAVPIVTTNASVPFGALILGDPPPQPEEIVGATCELDWLHPASIVPPTTLLLAKMQVLSVGVVNAAALELPLRVLLVILAFAVAVPILTALAQA